MNKDMAKYNEIKDSELYKLILSDQNIYNAIYALDSYVFEKGLLDKDDLDIYYRLKDKYDISHIKVIIEKCKSKLEKILSCDDELFEIQVYFKLKKYDKDTGKIKFRPMHTAELIDQICMVCMLIPLMFDDSSGERKLSDLSKLLPHNFFGNIPSTDVGFLFEKWQKKYKEYTDTTISHCREYQENHKYHTEVTLDIKNFFPSIDPKFIYEFIIEKLSATYRSEKDRFCLGAVVTKLLYFRLKNSDMVDWLEEYYDKSDGFENLPSYMSRGIPQGLPQSYLFGNLCMIEIKKVLDDIFKGDAYYYVDDSVIYIFESLDDKSFRERLSKLNSRLETLQEKCADVSSISEISDVISRKYLDLQSTFDYKISFHTDDKSDFRLIDDADNHLGGYENIARGTYMLANPHNGLDEIDDTVSLEKVNAYLEAVEYEIQRLEKAQRETEKEPESKGGVINNLYASRLKLMRRNKRFFLYRKRVLEVKKEGEYTDELKKDFDERFKLDLKNTEIDKEKWFDVFDEDIFLSECFLIMDMYNSDKAETFKSQITEFEYRFSKKKSGSSLYFSKTLDASLWMKELYEDKYKSLKSWTQKNFKENRGLGQSKQHHSLIKFIDEQKREMNEHGYDGEEFTRFVFRNSMEFKRMIINAYYSEMIGVIPADNLSFVKINARQITYTELRIMAQLRNKKFDCGQFAVFVKTLNPHDLSNRMEIDMGILSVLGFFITKVKKPEWIDSLIQTHRVVKGLWYNGSKFLNSYTLHNEEHAITLIEKSIRLIRAIDYMSIKTIDYYILFLACYLHDISMVLHPDLYEFNKKDKKSIVIITDFIADIQLQIDAFKKIAPNDDKNNRLKETGNFLIGVFQKVFDFFESSVRDKHPFESASYIRSSADRFFKHICPAILAFVAKISESHGYDAEEVYGLRSTARNDLVSIKYLMMLIRLADLLDVANDRVNYHLLRENVKHMNNTSRFHWISHLITDEIQLTAKYDVDEDKKLYEKPITEHLKFDLYLNYSYLSTLSIENKDKCNKCGLKFIDNSDSLYSPSEEYNGSKCMRLVIGQTCNGICPFLCRWIMKKHEWLVNELNELQSYLYSVNTSLIHTDICMNIYYRDEYKLDTDMLDYVKEYLS